MNRVVNIFTFLVLLVFTFMVMVSAFDLSISNLHLKGMPYQRETFSGFALIVLLLGLIRIQRRWQGIRDMKRYSSFKFVVPVSKKHRQQGLIFTVLECVFFLACIWACSFVLVLEPTYVIPMIIVLSVLIIESLVFALKLARGGIAFRAGFDDSVIAYFDREMHLFYYTGLKRAELYQQDLINFAYREDLNLPFETNVISEADRKAFRDALIQHLESKNIYVDDSLRNWQ